jgi:hypothetical protein
MFRESGKEALPRIKDGGDPVKTAEFQGNVPQFGTRYPERRGKGKGTRSKIGKRISFCQRKGQGRQKAAEPVEVPGKKIAEIRLKQIRPSGIRRPAFPAAGRKKTGKFGNVPGKAFPETRGEGKCLFDKIGNRIKHAARFGGKIAKQGSFPVF